MKTNLPKGYSAGPLTVENEQGAVDVLNKHYRWMNGGGNFTTLKEIRIDWAEDGFDQETDTLIVTDPQGQVVGYSDFWGGPPMHVRMYSLAAVDPDHLGCGIGSYMVEWVLERAQKSVDRAPEGARVVLHQGANTTNQAAYGVLTQHGFQVVRHSYRMRIDFDQAPVDPVIPDGIVIRSMIPGKEETDAIWTAYDAFKDHWGMVEEPFDEYCKRWMYYIENDPHYDPALYLVAMDGDQMAGVSLCYPRIEEDPGMAWVGTLGVRRNWRKRGLGLALLQQSFHEFYKRGIRRAGLGVDASNLTGAVRLYERAGMHVWRKNATYEYELRPGKDLMKQG